MVSGSSDRGDREHQEDAWLVARREGALLCGVCDGMGASTSGRPAANLALAMLRDAFEAGAGPEEICGALLAANRAIVARSQAAQRREPGSDIRWLGMGTTAEVALFVRGRAHLVHVGDGRIYSYRAGRLEQLTIDHTLREEYRSRTPNASEAEKDPIPEHVIVRALGMRADLEIDRAEIDTAPGDVFLVCSDGLVARLGDATIATVLAEGVTPEELVRTLITTALAERCAAWSLGDNMTAVVHVVDRHGV